jgi:hypothetical protein
MRHGKADTSRIHDAVQADIHEALIHERWLDVLVVCANKPPVGIEGDSGECRAEGEDAREGHSGDGVEVEVEEGGTVDGEEGEYVGEVDMLCATVNGEMAQGGQ